MKPIVSYIALAVGALWLSWNTLTLRKMQGELQSLRSGPLSAMRSETDPKISKEVIQQIVYRQQQAGASSATPSTPEEQEALVDIIEQTLEERETERKEAEVAQWLSMAQEGLELKVEAVAESYPIPSSTQEDIVDLMVDGMAAGIDLKQRVQEGSLSVRDAKAEGQALREETAAAITELIGEEAAEALWEEMEDRWR